MILNLRQERAVHPAQRLGVPPKYMPRAVARFGIWTTVWKQERLLFNRLGFPVLAENPGKPGQENGGGTDEQAVNEHNMAAVRLDVAGITKQ